jgi:hypothetical protein
MVKTIYVADFTDVADFFDAAYLLLSDKHDVTFVAPDAKLPLLLELIDLCGVSSSCVHTDVSTLSESPANWIVTSNYDAMLPVMRREPALRRCVIERLFVVGGHANDYSMQDQPMRIDPRLKEREPERFSPAGDVRGAETEAYRALLLSGEAVIWLPRDVCLWRYAAPQIFELGPNAVNAWLLALLSADRNTGEPVLLSTFPAFCLAVTPDTMPWLRLFHTVLGRVEVSPLTGRITPTITQQGANAYIVTAIDGFACGKFITNVLRGPAR